MSAIIDRPLALATTALSPGGSSREIGGMATYSARTNWNCSGVSFVKRDTDPILETETHWGASGSSH